MCIVLFFPLLGFDRSRVIGKFYPGNFETCPTQVYNLLNCISFDLGSPIEFFLSEGQLKL